MGLLLFAIISASTWASYRGVRDSAFEVGRERLKSLTQQFATQSQQSIPLLLNKTFTTANDAPVRSYLQHTSNSARPGLVASLRAFTSAEDPNSLQVELWNADHSLSLSLPEGSLPVAADLTTEFGQSAVEPFKTVSPLRVVNDIAVYAAVAAVRDDTGKLLGFLVRWRRAISPAPNIRKQLADLLGSDAALYFGNVKGDVWTDVEKPVPKPPVRLGPTPEVVVYKREGQSVMALGRLIAGTPWCVAIEFPEQVFLGQAHRFLRRLIMTDLVLLVVGLIGAFLLSRSIVGPLHWLTAAAARITGGDYSQTVNLTQHDELGMLARAFNIMAAKVRESRLDLEQKVKQLTLSETRKGAILKTALDCVITIDHRGNIIEFNPAAEATFGYLREGAIGKSMAELLIPGDLRQLHHEGFDKYQATGVGPILGNRIETRAVRADGTEFPVELAVTAVNGSEHTVFTGFVRDITARKQAEAELTDTNQRLEATLEALQSKTDELAEMTQQLWQASKLATMGELAASVAHELNNPLATITLRTETLLAVVPEKARPSLEIISAEIDRMATLVQSLLEFSRRGHQQISTLDVRVEITNSIDFIGYYLRKRNIQVVKSFADPLPMIHADRQQLRQLFLNLMTNASDAMLNGGTLIVAVRPREQNGSSSVEIEFADTGEGISPENLAKIWEPFFTTKGEGKGTGLGMGICRRIVEGHAGTMNIRSEEGSGTTVTITLAATSGK
jgi:PAS domain S-box-containing protein